MEKCDSIDILSYLATLLLKVRVGGYDNLPHVLDLTVTWLFFGWMVKGDHFGTFLPDLLNF